MRMIFKRPRLKLRWQLIGGIMPLLLLPLVVTGLVMHTVAERGLAVLVTQEAENRAQELSDQFVGYYATHGSWAGVSTLFATMVNIPLRPPGEINPINPNNPGDPNLTNARPGYHPPPVDKNPPPLRPTRPEQMLLTDPQGVIIAGNDSSVIGQTLSLETLVSGAPLIVKGHPVGTLVIGAALGLLDQGQRQLLDTLDQALLLSGGLSALIAVLLGLWLSHMITAPIHQLMRGVRGLASGQWSEPLPVRQSNELGDLTRTFNHMAEEMTHEQHLRRQMVADIAHELRTPLSIMALEVAAIREGLQTPAESATSLTEEIDWLQRLVDDLHTLSLMDAGQIDLHPEAVALRPFLQSIANQWQPITLKEQRSLAVMLPADLPVTCIDPHRMRQVLGNLLNNAVQHTDAGAHITLRADPHENDITIAVVDDGFGIDPEDLPHLFERFYRADRSRKRRLSTEGGYSGSGLGLAIAYQLVKLQSGQLSVQSTPGQGATFSVTLPILHA